MSFLFPSPAAGSGPVMSYAAKALRAGMVVIIGAWFVLLAGWLALHWAILPNIEQWRVPIEERVSAALGTTVKIGRIEVRSGSWVPAFELRDVVLLDAHQREALRLPRVAAALSPRSLLQLKPRFTQLLVDAPTLEVRRDAQGHVSIAGLPAALPAGDAATEEEAAADWIFSQREFVFRGGTLRWIDELRGAEPLVLADVQVVLRNGLRSHQVRLDATLPPALGDRLTLRGKFLGPILGRQSDWRGWSGTLYAELPDADVHSVRPYADLPPQVDSGRGALRGWVAFEAGRPTSLTLDTALRDVALNLVPDAPALAVSELSGRFEAQRRADRLTLSGSGVDLVVPDGRRWPAGTVNLTLAQTDDGRSLGLSDAPVTGGTLRADRLDLALLTELAGRLPLAPAQRQALADWAPQGQVQGLDAQWDGPASAPLRYRVEGRATDVALASGPPASPQPHAAGRPGVRGLTFTVSAHERGGTADVQMQDGAIEFPGVFDEAAIPLQQLTGRMSWRIEPAADAALPPKVEVVTRDMGFANADVAGRFDATWRTGAPGAGSGRGGYLPGVLDLQGQIERGLAERVARYLPRGLPETARRYVEQAVRGGTLSNVGYTVRGDLADFPASNAQQGEFRIGGRVRDVTLDAVPGEGWPALTQLGGELVFDRASMAIRDASARIGALVVDGTSGGIAHLGDKPVLTLSGNGRGSLADGLAFVNGSPVGHWIGSALAAASGTGQADVKLALNIPLDARPNTLKGSVILNGSDVRLRADAPWLRGARGRIDFTESTFAISGATARVFGGELGFEGGTAADGALRFTGQGSATAEGLRGAAGDLGALGPLAARLNGQSAYRVSLDVVRGQPEFVLTSTLQGLASDLPAPLAKPADAAWPLRVQGRITARADDGTPLRDAVTVQLGSVAQASFTRELGGSAPRVLRGGIGVGAAAPEPATGVHALVQMDTLDIDAWQRILPAGATPAGEAGGYAPDEIALKADRLQVAGRTLTHVVAGLSRAGTVWRATAAAEQLAGYAEWRPEPAGPGLVYARLDRLTLPRAEAESVETLLDAPDASRPALDIVIDDFTLRDRALGHVEIQAENRRSADGSGHDWRLSRLSLRVPEAQFVANGQWVRSTGAAARRRSQLDFSLDITDAGALLDRLGTRGALRGGHGRLGGQVGWLGSPLSPDVSSLDGDIQVSVESGQFLKAEPGAARLLGVLNLQALPRRLALDFRDVFQEGFAFDSAVGDVHIARGVAHSNNLRIRGVAAAVLMDGQADLDHETQDLRVIVVPEINAGTASLAYAVINPAVGLGTFLAQLLLRRPILAASTREFHVTGSWDDPKVEAVARSLNDPVPDVDAAASAPLPEVNPDPAGSTR